MLILKNVTLNYPIYGGLEPKLLTRTIASLVSAGKFVKNKKVSCVRSIDDLSLEVKSGERLGLLGNNGAGKTTLLKLMAGIYKPSSGSLTIEGSVCPILGTGFGLDEEATGYENIILGGIALGRSVAEMKGKISEITEFTELGTYLYMPIKTYSAGMKTRLAFAITTSFNSDIIAIDEGIGAGDSSFQAKAEKRLNKFLKRANILVMASHSNELLQKFCTHGLVMKSGKQEFHGTISEAIKYYKNHYK